MMNYRDFLINERSKLYEEIRHIDFLREEELRIASCEIIKKYKVMRAPLDERYSICNQEIVKLNDNKIRKSHFDSVQIGQILAELASAMEGVQYIFQQTKFKVIEVAHYTFDSDYVTNEYYVNSIVKKENASPLYDMTRWGKIRDLTDNKTMLILQKEQSRYDIGTQMTFYDYRDKLELSRVLYTPNCVEKTVSFEKFEYLGAFIDRVIDYKIKNNVTNIGTPKLKNIMTEFLVNMRPENKAKVLKK